MFTILHHKNNELMLLSVEKVLSQICRNKVREKNDGIGKYLYCRADINPITELKRNASTKPMVTSNATSHL
jgi:hypothetical protein